MMKRYTLLASAALALIALAGPREARAAEKPAAKKPAATRKAAKAPALPEVNRAMRECIASHEIAGAVTLVASRDKILHLGTAGQADIAAGKPMRADAMFWIASMTKPITASAILMLQDEGKLSVDDPVAKYIPEMAKVKTREGAPGNLTLRHLLTHTSGLAEATPQENLAAKTLAELIPAYVSKPLQFKPGSRWQYCQSAINTLGRIIEVTSGMSYAEFMQARLFTPLGMKDTTFFPTARQAARIATAYKLTGGALAPEEVKADYNYKRAGADGRCAFPNGGLYSTAQDYARFARMILNGGELNGRRYLKPETVKLMTTIQTGDIKTGFTEGHGWGLGWCVVRQPQGVTAMLSPGTCGHGGAYGTQAWIDPVKGRIYIMMVQRSNFPNSDGSSVRAKFQAAAVKALEK